MRFRLAAMLASAAALISAAAAESPSVAQLDAEARAEFPLAGARATVPGEAVFLAKCQYCHTAMGPGTLTLARRLGEKNALLANRTDLTPEYVKTVVREGLRSMPPITRVEVSDPELDVIAAYLSRPR